MHAWVRRLIAVAVIAILVAFALKKSHPQLITVSSAGRLDLKSVEGPVRIPRLHRLLLFHFSNQS